MRLELKRFAKTPMGVFGSLDIEGVRLYTVERPDLNNQRNISCIPAGDYRVVPRWYFRGGYDAYEIKKVMNRDHILIHIANTMHDVEGCVGLGTELGCVRGLWAVKNSRKAFNYFREVVGDREFTLRIERGV